MPRDFQKLQVWERSHQLTLEIYRTTRQYPREELFGLTSQMRRAAAAIPTNIAEGCGRSTQRDLARFMDIAHGSSSELSYQAMLSRDLDFLPSEPADDLLNELDQIGRMLNAYTAQLRQD